MRVRSIKGITEFLKIIIIRFVSLLNRLNDGSRILVFCETKKGVDEVTKLLRCDGWHSVKSIHGDKFQ
jgi:ATP-dependent RNA helicase DDX5/DBP2